MGKALLQYRLLATNQASVWLLEILDSAGQFSVHELIRQVGL